MKKNLVNCKPSEFLSQTMRIKKKAEKWIKEIEFEEIRNASVDLEKPKGNETPEEFKALTERNTKTVQKQAMQNLSKILENAFEKYPQDTLEILALCCFVEPAKVDEYPIREYLQNLNSMINDEAVLNFFLSLVQLGQMFTQNA